MLSINLYVKGCRLHHWSVPHVHTSGAFSPSEWGPDPQCQAAQVAQWIWWWQCLGAWHCRSVWSLPCHFSAYIGGRLTRAVHKATSWKRGGMKRELVADPWTSSRQFSHVLWLKVHSQWLLRAWLLLLLPSPLRQTAHGNLPELCRRSRPIPQITARITVSLRDNLHEVSDPIFYEKYYQFVVYWICP